MKEFIISIDSVSDLPIKYLSQNNVLVHELKYILDDKEYNSIMTEEEMKGFYKILKEGALPTTSALNPLYIKELFIKYIEKGYDILHISFSSGLSSCYNNAIIAAEETLEEYPNSKVIVIDTLSVTSGEGIIVKKAIELKKEGKTIEQVRDWIEDNKKRVIHEFVVSDLAHLVRGGRLSKPSAVIGGMLHIQPLLKLNDEGKIVPFEKVRGRRKALNTLVDNMKNQISSDTDTVLICHADCEEDAIYIKERIKEKYNINEIIITYMSPIIASHTGQGCVVFSYLGKHR